jgi:hypothetical protein
VSEEEQTVTPRADAARIDMDEGRARVISDAAPPERKRSIVQRQGVNSWDADVNRVSVHVLAVLGHSRRAGTKEFVARGIAIPTDGIDLRIWMAQSGSEIGKNVRLGIIR